VLYVFTARKQRLLERARRVEEPDTLLFGYNHLDAFRIAPSFYEPDYGRVGQRIARAVGRLGPDVLQLRTLPHLARFDVVFLTGCWPLLLAARAIPRTRRPRLVWLNMTLTNVLRRGGALARLVGSAVRCADRVVCVAQFQRDVLHTRLGLPPDRLPLALSGTDARFYDPARAAACSPAARPFVLAAGRDAGRDYATLARAVGGADYDVHLVCSPRNVAGVDLLRNVSVRHDIPPAALRDEYARAAAVVIPTRGDDFAGGSDCSGTLVLLDALAMGKPSVITARASVPDYVAPGAHALTVPAGDPAALRAAVDGLLADPSRGAALAAAGQEHVRAALTTRHFARRVAEVLHDVAG
jgi:glycosyltransferase involved in cell wall biosynthesis